MEKNSSKKKRKTITVDEIEPVSEIEKVCEENTIVVESVMKKTEEVELSLECVIKYKVKSEMDEFIQDVF